MDTLNNRMSALRSCVALLLILVLAACGSATGAGVRVTPVAVDPLTGGAPAGTVFVIDYNVNPATGQPVAEGGVPHRQLQFATGPGVLPTIIGAVGGVAAAATGGAFNLAAARELSCGGRGCSSGTGVGVYVEGASAYAGSGSYSGSVANAGAAIGGAPRGH